MRTLLRSASLLLAVATCALATADGFSIKRIPALGTIFKYKMTAELYANGSTGTLTATLQEKVAGIDKDGNFTIEQSQLDGSYTFDGENFDLPKRNPITMTYKPDGRLTLIQGDLVDANSYRIESLASLIDSGKQLNIGDAWADDIKGDKTLGTRQVHAEYKLVAEEKIGEIDTLRIKGTIKEVEGDNPATNVFTKWISKLDGSMVQFEAKWDKAPFPGISSPVPATIKITRIAP